MTQSLLDKLGRKYAALLFDMDGTVLNSAAVTDRVWGAWALRHGLDAGDVLAQVHGTRAVDALRRIGVVGLDIEAEAAALSYAELQDMEGVKAIPGAAAFLSSLPTDGWAIVTSSTRELALRRLRAAGLPVPGVLITAESITRGKPDPEGYLVAAAKLQVPIRDCIVFEDSPAGIAAGDAAGARVIVVGQGAIAGYSSIADYTNLDALALPPPPR